MGGLNVAIVGAGIGGLTAAIALDRRGVNVEVYEKAHELKELGAGSLSEQTARGSTTVLVSGTPSPR
jgi:2-polyprenyl-6-methoxyphenol hydroxylase-like FAD-dependent oxidoreductase